MDFSIILLIFAPSNLNMEDMYKRVIYNNREDAVAAFKKMVQRKREWVKQAEKELDDLALQRELAV